MQFGGISHLSHPFSSHSHLPWRHPSFQTCLRSPLLHDTRTQPSLQTHHPIGMSVARDKCPNSCVAWVTQIIQPLLVFLSFLFLLCPEKANKQTRKIKVHYHANYLIIGNFRDTNYLHFSQFEKNHKNLVMQKRKAWKLSDLVLQNREIKFHENFLR